MERDIAGKTAQGWNYMSTLLLIVFSIVLPASYSGFHDPPPGAPCTSYGVGADPAKSCWEGGGKFWGFDLTAPTVSIAFQNYSQGVIYDGPGLVRTIEQLPFPAAYEDDTKMENARIAHCAADAKIAADDYLLASCVAEAVPDVWQIPNRHRYRTAWDLSGGVHIWFFCWVSLWLSASFSVLMLPGGPIMSYIKVPVLMLWQLLGILAAVLMFIDDDSLHMRLPLNNVLVGVSMIIFTSIVQAYWIRVELVKDGDTHRPDMETQATAGLYSRVPGGSLSRLMAMGPSVVGVPGALAGQHVSHTFYSIFEGKKSSRLLLEGAFIEAALTVPLGVVAVFCACSRVNTDWMVQSILFRCYLIFACAAFCFKLFSLDSKPRMIGPRTQASAEKKDRGDLWLVMIVFAFTIFLLLFFFLADFYWAVYETSENISDDWSSGRKHAGYTMFAFLFLMVIIYVVTAIGLFMLSFFGNERVEAFFEGGAQVWAWVAIRILLLGYHCLIFTYGIEPRLWYGSFDRKDVWLDYPVANS